MNKNALNSRTKSPAPFPFIFGWSKIALRHVAASVLRAPGLTSQAPSSDSPLLQPAYLGQPQL